MLDVDYDNSVKTNRGADIRDGRDIPSHQPRRLALGTHGFARSCGRTRAGRLALTPSLFSADSRDAHSGPIRMYDVVGSKVARSRSIRGIESSVPRVPPYGSRLVTVGVTQNAEILELPS